VPAAEAERPLSVQSGDLRTDAGQWARRADSRRLRQGRLLEIAAETANDAVAKEGRHSQLRDPTRLMRGHNPLRHLANLLGMKRGDCRRATTAATHERRGRGPHGPAAGPLRRMAHGARGMPAVHPRRLVRLSWTNKLGPLRVLPTSTKEHLMAVTLYSGFVPVCVQLLTGLKTVLKKAEDHATTQKWDTAVVLNLRFYPD